MRGSPIKSVHPFPARMAPDLALDSLSDLERGSVVLDPMSGSGTVLRQATELGHVAIGFDLDPLAVLMSKVWNTPVDDLIIGELYEKLLVIAEEADSTSWGADKETSNFIDYWFAAAQIDCLGQIAHGLRTLSSEPLSDAENAALNVLRLNLSRIIVTKAQAASLARDTSHSRPHRVTLESGYDIFAGYHRSLDALRRRLLSQPPKLGARVSLGDARNLTDIGSRTIDAVVTSPPYLNAIDYLRGHRLSLVWLGWNIRDLRAIRAASIGTERGSDGGENQAIIDSMIGDLVLPNAHLRMVRRYASDVKAIVAEVSRVLKPNGSATFVVGNSCLKGQFISNASGLSAAAEMYNLTTKSQSERELPASSRYLPTTGDALGKRMRTETVLTFTAGA